MTETPIFFDHEGEALFGVFHAAGAPGVRPPFVFCHPFAEEKLWTHRVFVSFARRLAQAGHPVLRFDYRGNGDSGGLFSESSLESACSDVRRAVGQVRTMTGAAAVGLLGLRLGATIASLVAEDHEDVSRLVLWAPIVDGARYMQEMLRINLTTQMAVYREIRQDRAQMVEAMRQGATVTVDGYDLGFRLYEQVSAVKLSAAKKAFQRPCLIAQVDRQTERIVPELQQLKACYGNAAVAPVREEPFWKEIPQFYQEAPNLFAATDAWLQSN